VGTASLVVGIGFMLVGFAVIAQGFLGTYFTLEQMRDWIIFNAIIGIPLVIVGALFLRKYDSDKKKEKDGNGKQPMEDESTFKYKDEEAQPESSFKKQPERNLRKSPIVKGTIIGIIAVSIIWGLLFSFSYQSQSYVMTNDAMAPTINKFDIIRYEQTPIDEILLDDIVVYTDLSEQNKIMVHKVTGITYTDPLTLKVKNEASPTTHLVTEEHYVGKITSIEAGGGKINQIFTPQINIVILIIAFVTPIVLMKIRDLKKKEKNS